jgi:hypothetical protein
VKILKPGREQKGWSKEFECLGYGNGDGGCGAWLLVEQDDLFYTRSSCRDEVDVFVTFMCPSCKVLTDIKSPPSIKIRERRESDYPSFVIDPGLYGKGTK